MKEKILQLQESLSALTDKDHGFATDLIASFYKYGSLTPKQAPYIDQLLQRAANPAAKHFSKQITVGEFGGVVALFEKAKQHLKYPKIILNCMGEKIYISLAGVKSKHPGSIMVVGEGEYPNRPFFGSISSEGVWTTSKSATNVLTFQNALYDLLVALGQDPAHTAKTYGILTGNCCFCNSPLTDPKSTAAGFGPVCAEHYGLKEQWKMAVKNAGVPDGINATEDKTDLVAAVKKAVPNGGTVEATVGGTYFTIDSLSATVTYHNPCFFCGKKPAPMLREGVWLCAACDDEMTAPLDKL